MLTAKCCRIPDSHLSLSNFDLELGKEYEVYCISMGQSHTTVQLVSGKCYNSIYFKFFENGKEIDIYSDIRFNPYL